MVDKNQIEIKITPLSVSDLNVGKVEIKPSESTKPISFDTPKTPSSEAYKQDCFNLNEDDMFILEALSYESACPEVSDTPYNDFEYTSHSAPDISDSDNEVNDEANETQAEENPSQENYDSEINKLTQQYLRKPMSECSIQEINQAQTLSMLEASLETIKEGLKAQSDSDGLVSEAFDLMKYLTGLGIDQKDVEAAILKQEQTIEALKKAAQKGNFEEVFKQATGVEYDPVKISEYQQKEAEIKFIEMEVARSQAFCEALSDEDTMYDTQATFDKFIEFYGKEKGEKEFLEALKYGFNNTIDSGFYDPTNPIESINFDKNGNIVLKFQDKTTAQLGDISTINPNNLTPIYSEKFKNSLVENNLETFEQTTGLNYEQLVQEYTALSQETLGNANAVSNTLNEYIQSQEGFIDKFAGLVQLGGIGLIGLGSAAVFFSGGTAGLGMIKTGQWMALGGTFGDEALELTDTFTNNNFLTDKDKAKYREIFKDALTDAALLGAGYIAGSAANSFGNWVLSETGNEIAKFIADHGTDVALSLLGDMVITGEVDFKGEGFSQLLGIITGSAFSRINAMHQSNFEAADVFYKSGDYDNAYKSLIEKGYKDSDIQKYYGKQEIQRFNEMYEKTGDFTSVLALAQKSKLLNDNQIKNLEVTMMLKSLKQDGIEAAKYMGYDFSCPQGKLIADDIKMLYDAKTTGVNVNDLMVPTKANFEIGKSETKVGGLFESNGKLYLKTDENNCTELNISKETYCHLFPPLDRYSSGQQNSGDCYLVSALNAMMINPKAQEKLLSCFSESVDENGVKTITLALPDSDMKIEILDWETIDDLGVNPKKAMTGALGMQLLEYGYKKNLEYKEIKDLTDEITSIEENILTDWEMRKEYLTSLGIENYEVFYEKIKNPNLISNYKKDIEAKFNIEIDDLTFESLNYDFILAYDNGKLYPACRDLIMDKLGVDAKTAQDIYDNGLKEALALFNVNKNALKLEEYKAKLEKINNNPQYFEKLGGKGGSSNDVFKAFGLKGSCWGIGSDVQRPIYLDMIENPEKYKDCVITAGTMATKATYRNQYNDPDSSSYNYWHENPEIYQKTLNDAPDSLPLDYLVANHAYSFKIVQNGNGEIMFEVINPWAVHSSGDKRSFLLTLDEFKACFSNIYIGKLE